MADDYGRNNRITGSPAAPGGAEADGSGGAAFLRRLGTLLVTVLVVLGVVAVSMMGDGIPWTACAAGSTTAPRRRRSSTSLPPIPTTVRAGGRYLVVLTQNYLQFLEAAAPPISRWRSWPVPAGAGHRRRAGGPTTRGDRTSASSPEGWCWSGPFRRDTAISPPASTERLAGGVSEKSGYRGSVAVYNAEQQQVYGVDLSSQFVVDALVTEDCRSVLVVTYGEAEGAFCTNLVRMT